MGMRKSLPLTYHSSMLFTYLIFVSHPHQQKRRVKPHNSSLCTRCSKTFACKHLICNNCVGSLKVCSTPYSSLELPFHTMFHLSLAPSPSTFYSQYQICIFSQLLICFEYILYYWLCFSLILGDTKREEGGVERKWNMMWKLPHSHTPSFLYLLCSIIERKTYNITPT